MSDALTGDSRGSVRSTPSAARRKATGPLLCALVVAVSACASRAPADDEPAWRAPIDAGASDAGPQLVDLGGAPCSPLDVRDARAHVIVFTTTDCPIANAYAPEVRAIVREHAGDPLRFFLVHVDSSLEPDAARAHAREYGYELEGLAVLLDGEQRLVRALGVSVTPEAAVVGPGRALLYRGRIDDTWADLGRRRPRARTHELRDALRAVLAGQPVERPRAPAVGCDIPLRLAR